jgi:hypothetical protein
MTFWGVLKSGYWKGGGGGGPPPLGSNGLPHPARTKIAKMIEDRRKPVRLVMVDAALWS